ncbi:uncharacterized protein EDB93DRAFT_1239876 [Suillus bovinus]|uniref:uncharacterized protein n=1 Tax=Suillus bovinus TaxID=48563 RepID=UPI001B867E24|nr:uncharacterized protein EDB93DRAFT_1239876 [Suillus bovinus]KAG2153091.1 hypothetical protein EDB93DRAFT_1239876 [Suillus bovinus]
MKKALKDVDKLLKSKKTQFIGGLHLKLVVTNRRTFLDASERAAEAHGFAAKWGGRQLQGWTRKWLITRELPVSRQGHHAKVYLLLSDLAITSELRSYVRSNKWAVDPEKLTQFTKNQLIPSAADKYLQQIVHDEMPCGLKWYMEDELFPCIHLKAGCAQANDSKEKSWVFEDQHALRKKEVGRGLHQSDVICLTVGHLVEASQTLEYGKNYDGYWTGELFVKQLKEKIIPAFENAHGPGYQALFMVDNSQGHSAYSEDALLVSRMNIKPGRKQARMQDGWFMQDGTKVIQHMVYPPDHPSFQMSRKEPRLCLPNVKKYLCDNCDYTFNTLKDNMFIALASVPLQTIQQWEHQMHRWIDAYRMGLGTADAQLQVKKFSSRQYKSHRCIPDAVAQAFD